MVGELRYMRVKDVMTRGVISVGSDASVAAAAKVMKDKNIGTVLVIDGQDVKGLVTDRAIVTRVVGEDKDPRTVPVKAMMTRDIITCSEESDIVDAARILAENKVRRMPVTNASHELVGIVSVSDIALKIKPCVESIFDELTKATHR